MLELDKVLEEMIVRLGDLGSKTKLRKLMKDKGVCLVNGTMYGSKSLMFAAMKKNMSELLIPIELVREFQDPENDNYMYVKCCLVRPPKRRGRRNRNRSEVA